MFTCNQTLSITILSQYIYKSTAFFVHIFLWSYELVFAVGIDKNILKE